MGLGYVLGARAGREEYDRMAAWWHRATRSSIARRIAVRSRPLVERSAQWAEERAQGVPVARTIVNVMRPPALGDERIADIMTATVETVQAGRTLTEVARKMKELDVGAVVVVDGAQRVRGIVTDRDLAIRGAAEGKGPETAVEAILSDDVVTLSPEDSVATAVQAMREHAVRRIPVVVDARPVGIVSLGDLAIERDRHSALADISAAPPDR